MADVARPADPLAEKSGLMDDEPMKKKTFANRASANTATGNGISEKKRTTDGETATRGSDGETATRGSSPKRQKTDGGSLEDEFEALLNKLPEREDQRKGALRKFAEKMCAVVKMEELNAFLQQVKHCVRKPRAVDGPANVSEQKSMAEAGQAATSKASAPGGPPPKEDIAGSFNPLEVIEAKKPEAKPMEIKGWVAPKVEDRTPAEHTRYSDLLRELGTAEGAMTPGGEPSQERFNVVFQEAYESLCKRGKDWFSLYSNCRIPEDKNPKAVACIVEALKGKGEEGTAEVLAHFMKHKEISPAAMELGIAMINTPELNKSKLVGVLLAWIYPTPASSFGWSRIGWSFKSWMGQLKKYLNHVDSPLESLKICIDMFNNTFEEELELDRQDKLISKGSEYLEGNMEKAKLHLNLKGHDTVIVHPSPSPSTSQE